MRQGERLAKLFHAVLVAFNSTMQAPQNEGIQN